MFPAALRPFVASLGLAGIWVARAAEPEPPQKMAPVRVAGDVPLVKLGEIPLQTGRFGVEAVWHDNYLYVIAGGASFAEIFDTVERVDLRTQQSAPFVKLKQPRLFHRAVVDQRKIYVLGGRYFDPSSGSNFDPLLSPHGPRGPVRPNDPLSETFLDSVEIIDLDRGTVAAGPRMPVAKAHFAAAVHDHKLYVIGGQKARGTQTVNTNTVEILDLATGKWSNGIPMPTPRAAQAAVVGELILVPGGYTGTTALSVMEFFNPAEKAWKTLPDLCASRSAYSMAFLGKHLFLFGDYDATDEILAYNLATRQSSIFTLDYRRARHSATVVGDGLIYVVGGRRIASGPALDLVQVFALRTDPRAAKAGVAH